MNGVFDLGGTDGLGPVVQQDNEPTFRAEWEKWAFGLFPPCFRAGMYTLDEFRHEIEKMDPAEYLLTNYYEHWVHSTEQFAAKAGVLDLDELEARTQYYLDNPQAPFPERSDPELLGFIDAAVFGGAPAARPSDKTPAFKVGDRVRVVASSPPGHTRRARYVRGRCGEISAAHGTFVYPDSSGNGHGDAPEHLYTVRFTAEELWGAETAEPNAAVYADLWEPYIVHAGSN